MFILTCFIAYHHFHFISCFRRHKTLKLINHASWLTLTLGNIADILNDSADMTLLLIRIFLDKINNSSLNLTDIISVTVTKNLFLYHAVTSRVKNPVMYC